MSSRLATQVLVFWFCVFASIHSFAQRSSSAYQAATGGTAVDVNGVRRTANQYRGLRAPWNFSDRITATAPEYPFDERRQRHEGDGLFHVVIDPKTGIPIQVIALRSTGYAGLDDAAVTSLRHWRWRPHTWREVDIPVAFTMHGTGRPPPGAIRLPSPNDPGAGAAPWRPSAPVAPLTRSRFP